MTTPRIYLKCALNLESGITVEDAVAHRLLNVLRVKPGILIQVFNENSGEFLAEVTACDKKTCSFQVLKAIEKQSESPLNIHLAQCIARGKKMDMIIQKSVELGVNSITPIYSVHGNVQHDPGRAANRTSHWQQVAIAAAEQCGRTAITTVNHAMPLSVFSETPPDGFKVILNPKGPEPFAHIDLREEKVVLIIGPEGGFSENELEMLTGRGFHSYHLGPRVLRTETVALVACALLQATAGDLAI